MTALRVEAAEKAFRTVKAVDGLSFEVGAGEIFALLGPNGAGKTTMVRMLNRIIRPDRGRIRWSLGGSEGWPASSSLGYLPEERGLYKDVPALRSLIYLGVLRGMSRRHAQREALTWLERVGLRERAKEKIDAFSKGNQQKIQFVAAVLHRPSFVILDEPFSGLDPVNQDVFLQILRELRDSGTTIMLSAHQMQLVERLADRILLMDRGRRVLEGTLDEVRESADFGSKLTLKVRGQVDLDGLAAHSAVVSAESPGDGELHLLVRRGESLSELLVQLGSSLEILSVHSERTSLHDIYVRAVSGQSNGDGESR